MLAALCVSLIASFAPLSFADTLPVVASPSQSYSVVVDRDLSLEQMIAAGRYDWVDRDFTPKNFPLTGSGKQKLTVEVVHFGGTMSSEQVVAELSKRGLRLATIEELLAFGAQHPNLLHGYEIIVALGSVAEVNGKRIVPCLNRGGRERHLYFYLSDDVWLGSDRFLAVRN